MLLLDQSNLISFQFSAEGPVYIHRICFDPDSGSFRYSKDIISLLGDAYTVIRLPMGLKIKIYIDRQYFMRTSFTSKIWRVLVMFHYVLNQFVFLCHSRGNIKI